MNRTPIIGCSATMLAAVVGLACADSATAPPAVVGVELYAGDAQVRYPGSRLLGAIGIQAVDAGGSPVEYPGLPVEWVVVNGGGSVDAATATNDRGRATAAWILGPSPGDQRLEARIGGSPPVQVTARAVAPGPIVFARLNPGSTGSVGIFTMNADGSDPAVAAPGEGGAPAWAPDGSAIVFTKDLSNGTSQLFRISTDGWSTSQMTSEAAPDARGLLHIAPSFSPDGKRIVYNLKTSHPDCGNIAWTQIFVADADGSNRVRLTDGCGLANSQATFSPTGDRIAFRSKRDESSAGVPTDPRFSIFVMDADGSGQTRLTPLGPSEDNPVWAPDGSRIYFTKDRREVWSVQPNGSGEELLWAPDINIRAFATKGVSPDDTRLLLDIWRSSGAFEVVTLELATGEMRILSEGAYDSSWRR